MSRSWSRELSRLLALVVGALVSGCSDDNATRLADRVREGAAGLSSSAAGETVTVSYEPLTAAPYTVVFFPSHEMTESDLAAAGVPKEVASRVYAEMAYLGSMSSVLVVEQEGQRLAFTTAWKHVAEVTDLVVLPRKNGGAATIDLRREDGTIRVVAIH
jgi:hypothetical protein